MMNRAEAGVAIIQLVEGLEKPSIYFVCIPRPIKKINPEPPTVRGRGIYF